MTCSLPSGTYPGCASTCTCRSNPATTPSSSRCGAATRLTSTGRSSLTPAMSSLTCRCRPMSSSATRAKRRNSSSGRSLFWRRSSSTSSTSRASHRDRARRPPGKRMMWHLPRRNAGSIFCSRHNAGLRKMPTSAGWARPSRCWSSGRIRGRPPVGRGRTAWSSGRRRLVPSLGPSVACPSSTPPPGNFAARYSTRTTLKPVPVLEQYEAVKREHADAIVLFRLGDFYETFGEDAERAAPLLGITLTSRELGKGQRFPMAGVPYHAYESYVGKLLRAGLKVALCDQVEQAGEARGLVRREVVRVLTPGTVVEDAYLEGGGTNYAVAVCLRSHYHGIAALDCSTGELALLRVDPTDDALRDELTRLRRAELVASEADRPRVVSLAGTTPVSWVDPLDFDARAAVDRLLNLLGVDTLAAFGCDDWPEALAAAHALLRHAERSHLRLEAGLLRLHAEHPRAYMHLDPATRRSLGLTEDRSPSGDDLVGLMVREATTTMGARVLRRWLSPPLRTREPLDARLGWVTQLVEDPLARGQ